MEAQPTPREAADAALMEADKLWRQHPAFTAALSLVAAANAVSALREARLAYAPACDHSLRFQQAVSEQELDELERLQVTADNAERAATAALDHAYFRLSFLPYELLQSVRPEPLKQLSDLCGHLALALATALQERTRKAG